MLGAKQFRVRIPAIVRRRDGYIAIVVWAYGQTEWAERVGPFPSPQAIALWLDSLEREVLEVLAPEQLGLPAEIALLRPPGEHAQRCYEALVARRAQP